MATRLKVINPQNASSPFIRSLTKGSTVTVNDEDVSLLLLDGVCVRYVAGLDDNEVNWVDIVGADAGVLAVAASAIPKNTSFAAASGKHYSVDTDNAVTTPAVLPTFEVPGIRFIGLTWDSPVVVSLVFYADYGGSGYYTDSSNLYLYGDNTRTLADIITDANDSGLVTAELVTPDTGGNPIGNVEGDSNLSGGSPASTTYTDIDVILPEPTGSRAVIQFSDARATWGSNGPYFYTEADAPINGIAGTKRITTPALLATFVDVGLPDGWRIYTGVSVPECTVLPVVTGAPTEYSTLACSQGTWSNAPTEWRYQWQLSAEGSTGWADIESATNASYTALTAQIASYLRCGVVAISAAGNSEPAYSLAAGPVTEITLLTGLIAHWKLNETTGTRYDSHGSYDLTANNTIGAAAGILGNCADFTLGSYLSGAVLPLTGRDVSLSYWVKSPTMTGGYEGYSLPPITGDSAFGIGGYIAAESGGHPAGCVAVDVYYDTNFTRVQGSTRVDNDQWNHVCMTCDGTTVKLFINGVLDASEPAVEDGSFGVPSGGTYINGAGSLGAAVIKYDSVSIWGRALLPAEVTVLYNGGDGLDYESFGG